ncbi:MAG: hypothetical protein Kow00123_15620 [Anaerolineales bacterium]
MKARTVVLLVLVAMLLVSGAGRALSDGVYEISWYTVDGGGHAFSTGGGYSLGGTVGQPDAGALSGGAYTLLGGFWGGWADWWGIYLPVVLRGAP